MRYLGLAEVVDLHRRILLNLAASRIERNQLVDWLRQHVKPIA